MKRILVVALFLFAAVMVNAQGIGRGNPYVSPTDPSFTNITVSGNATIGGTLGVTGDSVFGSVAISTISSAIQFSDNIYHNGTWFYTTRIQVGNGVYDTNGVLRIAMNAANTILTAREGADVSVTKNFKTDTSHHASTATFAVGLEITGTASVPTSGYGQGALYNDTDNIVLYYSTEVVTGAHSWIQLNSPLVP